MNIEGKEINLTLLSSCAISAAISELVDIINDRSRDMSTFIMECFMSDMDEGHTTAYKERMKHKLVTLLEELYNEL